MNYEQSLTIVIATQNRHLNLLRLLDSLRQPINEFSGLEIVIVEDGESFIDIAQFADLKNQKNIKIVRHQKRKGMAAARNTGIRNSTNSIIGFLDDDAICTEHWINSVRLFFSVFKDVNIIGGIVLPMDDACNLYSSLRHNIYYTETFGSSYFEVMSKPEYSAFTPKIIPYASGGNSAYKREVFDKYGLFNESLPAYIDIEFGMRLAKEDHPRLNPAMTILHLHPYTLRAFLIRSYTSGRAKAILSRLYNASYSVSNVNKQIKTAITNLLFHNFNRVFLLKPHHRIQGYFALTLSEIAHLLGIYKELIFNYK